MHYLSLLLSRDAIDQVKALKDSLPEGLFLSCSFVFHRDEPTNLLSILGTKVGARVQVQRWKENITMSTCRCQTHIVKYMHCIHRHSWNLTGKTCSVYLNTCMGNFCHMVLYIVDYIIHFMQGHYHLNCHYQILKKQT